MRVLITGANGFIGKNLILALKERDDCEIITFNRDNHFDELPKMIKGVGLVFHLAGINRTKNEDDFITGNYILTKKICDAVKSTGKLIPIVYTSSIQAEIDNDYGRSKKAAEGELLSLQKKIDNPIYIYRLANVFGKWARPNYNSVVATFCYNLNRDLPIYVNDAKTIIRLTYIDDVIASFMTLLDMDANKPFELNKINEYQITLGRLEEQLKCFKESRNNLILENVGSGLVRALYSTYMSYMPTYCFNYPVFQHKDERGVFVEMLKTSNNGQISYFTAHPGVTRGGHYHHSKSEKFLIISGEALFRFRHINTNEYYEINTSGKVNEIIETVPGWVHDVTNIGECDLICLLWANEIFDKDKPDTIFASTNIILKDSYE
ncbi:NAD-dependent epimerase/dehydratase family protein [Amylibacter sp.]|nr:NAD-dependent epimerase/dehydratase family protein [Amylibacter sp.]